jgi:hypothetical protein
VIRPGPELAARNRRILAERLRWSDGAVELCEQLDALNPGWHADWRHAWRDNPAGFYARHDNHSHLEPEMYGATAGELQAAIMTHRCRYSS